jgi:hypothetical protein
MNFPDKEIIAQEWARLKRLKTSPIIPVQLASIIGYLVLSARHRLWIPACAGITNKIIWPKATGRLSVTW